MTALATVRDTKEISYQPIPSLLNNLLAAANVKLWQGAAACVPLAGTAAGYVQPASSALNLVALGRVEKTFDNTGGVAGGASIDAPVGRSYVEVKCGQFWFTNSASTDLIAQSQLFSLCYLVDDNVVAKTSNGGVRSIAGMVVGIDPVLGVCVLMGPWIAGIAQQANTSIQYVKNKTLVAGTLAVTTGVTITANSLIIPLRNVPDVVAAHWGLLTITTPVVGGPGVGAFTLQSANAADVSTCDAIIIG